MKSFIKLRYLYGYKFSITLLNYFIFFQAAANATIPKLRTHWVAHFNILLFVINLSLNCFPSLMYTFVQINAIYLETYLDCRGRGPQQRPLLPGNVWFWPIVCVCPTYCTVGDKPKTPLWGSIGSTIDN